MLIPEERYLQESRSVRKNFQHEQERVSTVLSNTFSWHPFVHTLRMSSATMDAFEEIIHTVFAWAVFCLFSFLPWLLRNGSLVLANFVHPMHGKILCNNLSYGFDPYQSNKSSMLFELC